MKQTMFWFSFPFLVVLGVFLVMSSQMVFGESMVLIPIDASETTCAESGSCFLPSEVSVSVGDKVTWSNEDLVVHTVTSGNPTDDADGTFDSKIILAGDTYSHVFEQKGEFLYFCSIHPWMQGTVVVR